MFFDNIKYEDALKILQYSEPYKVQFKVRRKAPARGDVERAASGAQRAPKTTQKQVRHLAGAEADMGPAFPLCPLNPGSQDFCTGTNKVTVPIF